MRKGQLSQLLDNYDEKASWAFLQGYWPSSEINELHKICQIELNSLHNDENIPEATIDKIKNITSHYREQWSGPASEFLEELSELLAKEPATSYSKSPSMR